MPHGKPSGNHFLFDPLRKFEKPQGVGDGSAVFAQPFSQFILGQAKLVGQLRVSIGFFNGNRSLIFKCCSVYLPGRD